MLSPQLRNKVHSLWTMFWTAGMTNPLVAMFTGYDNDRSMVRIGWMNLILHGLEFPRIEQRDSLSKRMSEAESGTYDFILANLCLRSNALASSRGAAS